MLIIGNGTVLTLGKNNQVLENGAVAIDGKLIAEVGNTEELKNKYPAADWVDAHGQVIMPGMTNTHMHLYSTFARGMALKDPPPQNFVQILERLWWRLDKKLTEEDVYYSALLPLIDCIKNGTTTILDHHASPYAVDGSLDVIAKAVRETGVRSCLAYEVSDRDGEEIAKKGIAENVRFIKACRAHKEEEDLLAGLFGLHASFTLSDQTLEACAAAAEGLNTGFHVHTAEDLADRVDSLKRSGEPVVKRLDRFGIWNEKSIAVHCVHIDESEMDVLKERGSNVVHNPESNMGNAVGVADVFTMLDKGLLVGMGTDGYTADMFEGLKVGHLLHRITRRNPSVAWNEIQTLLFANNQAIIAKYFPHKVGELTPGAYGDVIVVDYPRFTPFTADNWYGHVLFGFIGAKVTTTVINGKVLMKDRKLLYLDEEVINARARELSAKLWERF